MNPDCRRVSALNRGAKEWRAGLLAKAIINLIQRQNVIIARKRSGASVAIELPVAQLYCKL